MFSLERQRSGDERVHNGEDDQAVDEESEDDGGEVPAKLHQHLPKVAHAQHLQERDPNDSDAALPPARL